MKTKLLILFILSGFIATAQKICDLTTTTTGSTSDFLLKNDVACTSGTTKKITVADFITTYSLQTGSGSSVTSVTGTTNRITSTGGTTPVIDISSSYVGQSSLTTLGTIGTGVWQGTLVGSTYGGTGVNNAGRTLTLNTNNAAFTFGGAYTLTVPATGTATLGTGTTNAFTKWTGTNTVDTSTVLKETGGHLIVTNGSLIKSDNGLNSASIGNGQASLESDNGVGSTASLYSAATAAGALSNDGVNLVEFYVDAPNNRARVNTTAGGEITLNSGVAGTIALTTGTVTVDGSLTINDGTQAVGSVFTCTSAGGAGTWQAASGGLSGTTGSIVSFSATNTQSNISAVAAGSYLRSAGTATLPVWSTTKLLNAGTANYVPYWSSTNTQGESVNLQFNGTTLNIGGHATLGTEILSTQKNQNAITQSVVSNSTSGTAARAVHSIYTDGTTGISMSANSSGYTTSGMFASATSTLHSTQTGGMNVGTTGSANVAFWTNNTERIRVESGGNVGIGTTTISARLHIMSTTEQQRTGYDASNYYSTTVGSTGGVTFNAVGSGSTFTFSDKIINSLPINMKAYTVATLPAGVQGDQAFVTDATAPTYLGALTGGGAAVCPVFYNGSAWVSH